MKRILLTTVSLGVLGLVSPALGADLPYAKAPVVSAPAYDWSGFYVGGFGGGGYGNHNVNNANGPSSTAPTDFTANYTSIGGVAGGEAGYNWQSGSYVVGLEGDLFWSGIKGNDTNQFIAGNFPGVTGIDADNLKWGGTVRVRAGYTLDRWMLFFTGGYAFGEIEHTNTAATIDKFTVHANGLTAGGGIAYAITNNVIGKFEYRYTNFNGYNRPNPPNGVLPYTTESTYSVVTLGLDFKFGGPVVAKY
jgi:outer membrane immunogenic protein